MIRLNYLLLTMDNTRIWVLVCVGVAIVSLSLIFYVRRFPKINRAGYFIYWGLVLIVCGCMLLYIGVSRICKQRRILKDDVRTMGVVRRIERTDEKYRFFIVFTDEQGKQHECKTWSKHKIHFVSKKVPVAYYRPDPDQAIVNPSWRTFSDPLFGLLIAFFLLITSSIPLRHAKKIIKGQVDKEEESPREPKTERARAAEQQFRIACKNALADGEVTVNEKQKLKMLVKYFEISKQAAKEIIKDEVRIFRQERKAR